MITKEEAMDLLMAKNPEPHMISHALESEAVLAAMAEKLGQDAALWGLTGLLHDVDYPVTKDDPAKHGLMALDILDGKLPQDALDAIAAHNSEYTGREPKSVFDFALRCGETVTGLISAAALVRPTKMEGMKAKSLKKKIKDKSFAANVRREVLMECEKAGLSLDDFLALSIDAITRIAPQVGLA